MTRQRIFVVCVNCRWNGGFLDAFWIRGWKCIKLVGTSRRPHVATLRHRDVSAISASPSLKEKRNQNSRYRRSYELGHGNQSSSDLDLEEEPDFCIFSSFRIEVLMLYRLNIGVLIFSMF